MQLQVIQNKIYEIRGVKVMLDFDLAAMYEVETKVFNQAVKRNIDSFPDDFMFKLTREEWKNNRSQIVTSYSQEADNQNNKSSKSATATIKHRSKLYLPYAFTEHGVTMLASVLKSPVARKMNIAIVRAFIALRTVAMEYREIIAALEELRDRMGGYDAQLSQIYDALENMLDKKVKEETALEDWKDRDRVGFQIRKK